MKAVTLVVLAAVVGMVAASAMLHRKSFHEVNLDARSDWKSMGPAHASQEVELMFAVKQRNLDTLEARLMAVSDPKSPEYGQFYTFEQIGEVFGNPEAVAAVHKFLGEYQVKDVKTTPNQEYVSVKTTVGEAQRMLLAEFNNYVHVVRSDIVLARANKYSLPKRLAHHVAFVGYVNSLPEIQVKPDFKVADKALGDDDGANIATPQIISSHYGITNNTVSNIKSTNSVFETIGQSFVASDLTAYDNQYSVPPQAIFKIIGTNSPSSCTANPNNCVEAELDVQVITAIAQSAHTTFWSIPGTESFLSWAQAVAADSEAPLVHSISYGSTETGQPASQMNAFDTEVSKLGLRGISVLVASGDDGVAGYNARSDPSACGFAPSYPATAPHVTAVGATQGPEASQPEIGCSSATGGGITSGGGFSTVYDQPSYQSDAVKHYMSVAKNLPPAAQYNGKGRGYPDVSAMGHNFAICVGGQFYTGSGTSASTPLFAGVITLINAARLNAGKAPLGFLNPALYSLPATAFHDITSGENNCCAGSAGSQTCCTYGFTASEGWDPMTGLGSPNYPNLVAALLKI